MTIFDNMVPALAGALAARGYETLTPVQTSVLAPEAEGVDLADYPQADRQHLRQLARNAKEEKLHNKPLHAYRELFRELKQLVSGSADGGEQDESIEQSDEAADDTDEREDPRQA